MNARVLPGAGGARPSAGAADRAGAPDLTAPAEVPAPRTVGPAAFVGMALTSFGGPLALAALMVPSAVAQAHSAAGLATLAGALVFVAPLAIWLRYSRHIHSAGGLYAFVRAAAGREVALIQAAIWIVSYALYLVYTTVQIVYDVLPEVLPAERHAQTALALLIPVAVAALMVAGRGPALIAMGLIGVGQVALAGVLDGVTLAHLPLAARSFGLSAPRGATASAGAQTSLLYICGSLPLFLGGELAAPVRTIRRGLTGSYLVTVLVVVLAVAPLAAAPVLLHAPFPGVSVARRFSGDTLASAVGVGVAVSIGGLILAEYFALTRLLQALTRWRPRRSAAVIGAVLVLAAPFTLIHPERFYEALARPSLVALWLSQLIVFAVFPLFARRHGQRLLPASVFAALACSLAGYGLYEAIQQASS
jgi:amino acid transporter